MDIVLPAARNFEYVCSYGERHNPGVIVSQDILQRDICDAISFDRFAADSVPMTDKCMSCAGYLVALCELVPLVDKAVGLP